ncbi:hypothetical protein [Streptomyces sp. NPDC001070]
MSTGTAEASLSLPNPLARVPGRTPVDKHQDWDADGSRSTFRHRLELV